MIIDYDLFATLAKEYDYEYQIEDLYGKMIANRLDKEFGVYVDFNESYNEFNCKAIGLTVKMSDVKSYEDLRKIFKSKFESNSDDTFLKDKFSYIMSDIGVESKVGELKDYGSYFNTMGFFDLLWYVKTDEFKRDGSKGSELMKIAQDYADKYQNDNATFFYPRSGLQYQIRMGEWIDMTTVDAKFSGWMIKFFKNGKIQIKGMSDRDWDKIVHIDEVCNS